MIRHAKFSQSHSQLVQNDDTAEARHFQKTKSFCIIKRYTNVYSEEPNNKPLSSSVTSDAVCPFIFEFFAPITLKNQKKNVQIIGHRLYLLVSSSLWDCHLPINATSGFHKKIYHTIFLIGVGQQQIVFSTYASKNKSSIVL